MANNHVRIDPQPQDISDGELGNLSPSQGRSNPGGFSSPDIVEFANRMMWHGEAYAAWKAQRASPAPEAETQSLAVLQQEQAYVNQQREENQSLNALRQDQQQMDQVREEQLSLGALHQAYAANDNNPLWQAQRAQGEVSRPTTALSNNLSLSQQGEAGGNRKLEIGRESTALNPAPSSSQETGRDLETIMRDGRESLFRPNGPQLNAQEHIQEQGIEEQRSADRYSLENDPSQGQETQRGAEELKRDGREDLFRPHAPEQDTQEHTQTQERERQMELDR